MAKKTYANQSGTLFNYFPGTFFDYYLQTSQIHEQIVSQLAAQLTWSHFIETLPIKVSTGPAGKVVLDIVVTRTGTVVSTSISSSSTLVVVDIVDACKEAALKTGFSYNPDAPDKQRGSITYTFTPRLR